MSDLLIRLVSTEKLHISFLNIDSEFFSAARALDASFNT